MMSKQPPTQPDQVLLERLVGASVRALQVIGINTLKTVEPPPDAVVGRTVVAVRAYGRQVAISTDQHHLLIDLARTGQITPLEVAGLWRPGDRGAAPTIRLLVDDGSGLDFAEPAKTKRITLSIRAWS